MLSNESSKHEEIKPVHSDHEESKDNETSTVGKLTKKQIAKRKRKKAPNDDVSNERRQALLSLILKTNSIRQAANQLGINNSTAKSIFYKYKQTG